MCLHLSQTRISLVLLLLLWMGSGALPGSAPAPAQALDLFLALDVSGSMRTSDPRRLLPQAVRLLVTLAREGDSLGYLTFEDGARVRLPLEPVTDAHRRRALAELRRLAPRGLYTDLAAALAQGLEVLTAPNGEIRGALVLLTDGKMDPNPAKGTAKSALERLRTDLLPEYVRRHIPIYTVAFTDQSDQALLRDLAGQTGGRYFLVPDPAALHQAFTAIYDDREHPQMAPVQGNAFVIDPSVQEATVVITRASLGRSSTLIAPDGSRYSYRSVREPVRWFAADAFDLVTIPHPAPGTWRLEGQQKDASRVLLLTDLALSCPFLPYTAGEDEDLLVAAGLEQAQALVTDPAVLGSTTFTATLYQGSEVSAALGGEKNAAPSNHAEVPLGPPGLGLPLTTPPGLLWGSLPTPARQGTWDLRVQALGKTFQRERHFRLEIGPPWLQLQAPAPTPGAEVTVDVKTAAGRQARGLSGWVGLREPSGLIQAIGLASEKLADFQFAFQPSLPGVYQVGLQLSGLTDSGRPLRLHVRPVPVTVSAPAPGAPPPSPPAPPPDSRWRRFLPGVKIGALALAGVLVLAGVILLLRLRPRLGGLLFRRRPPGPDVPGEPSAAGASASQAPTSVEQENLLLKAQVESLKESLAKSREEAQALKKNFEALNQESQKDKAELTTQVENLRQQAKRLPELESQVSKAETDLQNMQEEYMALYSRTKQEKDVLKKN